MKNSDFWPFQVFPFKLLYVAITTLDWGKPFKLLLIYTSKRYHLLPGNGIAVKTLIN